jgi:hypothetical protein
MATLDSLLNPGVSAQVDPSFLALRVGVRPLEYQSADKTKLLGHYRTAFLAAALAPTANAIMAALRWTDPNNLCVPLRIAALVSVATAVTAQRLDPLALFIARGYTAADGTGATAIVTTNNNQKVRANMGTSLAALSVTSAAGGMTGGTKTVDANAIGFAGLSGAAAIAGLGTGAPLQDLYSIDAVKHPVVLGVNEGLLVQWGATTLATGTIVVGFQFEWAEVPSF